MRDLPNHLQKKVLAAAQLFADFGLDATKMEDIAAHTGVPKATLYYYFEGKEEILAFLFAEILEEVARAVHSAASTAGTAQERLRAVIAAHLCVFEAQPAASRALQFDLGRAARIPLISERTEESFLGPVRELLEAGAADGSLRLLQHPRLVAVAVLGAVTTVGINALTIDPTRSAAEVADDVIDFVLRGVAS